MRKTAFYPKLAAQNIRRSRQFYLPFILTCILTTAMFYIMCFLTYNPATVALDQADATQRTALLTEAAQNLAGRLLPALAALPQEDNELLRDGMTESDFTAFLDLLNAL